MLDWEIREEADLPLADEESESLPRSRRGYWLGIGGFLLLAALTAGLVALRFRDAEEALKADLLVQVRLEESARRFGETSRLNVILGEDVPRRWRDHFRSLFHKPEGEVAPVEVAIEGVEIDGLRADVWAQVGAQRQRRAYAQTPAGWRRVPLEVNSETFGETVYTLRQGVELRHRASDRAFAEALGADMRALKISVAAWYGETATQAVQNAPSPSIIYIQPEEHRPALLDVDVERQTVILNSPQVVALPVVWDISGEAAVRYALARAVWGTRAVTSVDVRDLPGVHHYVNASRAVLALRWALTPQEYETLTARWRAALNAVGWTSPFFDPEPGDASIDPFAPAPQALRMLLIADHVVDRIGTDQASLARVLPLLRESENWDQLFGTLAGARTVDIESLVSGQASQTLPLPLAAAVAPYENSSRDASRFAVRSDLQFYQPVLVEGLPDATLTLPDGTSINPFCAPLFGALEIEGTWREENLRLVAETIRVNEVTLPTGFTTADPPDDTILYVMRSDNLDNGFQGIRNIAAMTPDGRFTPVLTPDNPDALTVAEYGWGLNHSTDGIMLTANVARSGCAGNWFMRYVPGVGVTGAWLYPGRNATISTLVSWDDLSGRGILVEFSYESSASGLTRAPFWWLEEGEPRVLGEPDGFVPNSPTVMLRPGGDGILQYQPDYNVTQGPAMVLLDGETLEERAVYIAPEAVYYGSGHAFSPDGRYLYLAWSSAFTESTYRESSALQRIDLETGEIEQWWPPERGSLFTVIPDLLAPELYALTYTPPHGAELVRIRADAVTPIVDMGEAMNIALVRRCGGGGLVYLALDLPQEQETRFELDPRVLQFVAPGGGEAATFSLLADTMPVLCP